MDWNCKLSEERLSEYLDGLLSPAEAATFATHAAGCSNCAQLLSKVNGLVGQLHQLEELEAPPLLVQNILDATIGPRTKKAGWTKWFAWVPALWQPRFAMGAITVAASFAIVIHTSGVTPAKLKKADFNPISIARSANRTAHLTYARSVKFVNDLRVVYEIQSRLQPGPDPLPASAPLPEQQTHPPSTAPQQKSEKDPPRDRSQLRNESMFAMLMPANLPLDFTATLIRSSR